MQVGLQDNTAANQQVKELVKNRIWRLSHSLGSVKTFDIGINKFERYMQEKGLIYSDVLKSPIQILDDFSAWMDRKHEPATTRLYVHMVKKLIKGFGVKIDAQEFRENVVLPKKRQLQDDKVNEDQIRRIILACRNERLKVVLMFMKDTQIRPAELLGMRLSDINITHDPPFLTVEADMAKNDVPRELFFTPETKDVFLSYIQNRNIKDARQYVFLNGLKHPCDEQVLKTSIRITAINLGVDFRELMTKPEFADMNNIIDKRTGIQKRYKIHPYSFKKFAFTRMADTVGEVAAKAIKGDKEYVLTYYKKSREERAEDYGKMISKLSVFIPDNQARIREQVEDAIKTLKKEDLTGLLDFIKGKRPARE